ncbi:hypothetical protein M501DRAFT_1058819 [Patellaria atrata CBS 101060]|uniref:Uncharacterized protein n=1 Tax=Patellaria atrata CBS 101060 TaxID=1346257 RepID=A0A9P4SA18_9PEZI|nr:hypothetical protein M501DRAFT_1058819 [Patellaria atrata CBS 101060]
MPTPYGRPFSHGSSGHRRHPRAGRSSHKSALPFPYGGSTTGSGPSSASNTGPGNQNSNSNTSVQAPAQDIPKEPPPDYTENASEPTQTQDGGFGSGHRIPRGLDQGVGGYDNSNYGVPDDSHLGYNQNRTQGFGNIHGIGHGLEQGAGYNLGHGLNHGFNHDLGFHQGFAQPPAVALTHAATLRLMPPRLCRFCAGPPNLRGHFCVDNPYLNCTFDPRFTGRVFAREFVPGMRDFVGLDQDFENLVDEESLLDFSGSDDETYRELFGFDTPLDRAIRRQGLRRRYRRRW